MGTEDGRAGPFQRRLARYTRNRLLSSVASSQPARYAIVFLLLLLWVGRYIPSPERYQQSTFLSSSTPPSMINLPDGCEAHVERFQQCQQRHPVDNIKATTSATTWVLACHRKWCNSQWLGGHCEPCAGIGDRTRFMMNQVARAVGQCIRVELDYPVPGLAIWDEAVYEDPGGWWGELGHYRSYQIANHSHVLYRTLANGQHVRYSHFFHKEETKARVGESHKKEWQRDFEFGCLYHTLLRPDPALQREIEASNAEIGKHTGPSIGIHFRTGDVSSFGLESFGDKRVGNVEQGWEKMLQCAKSLASQLYPGHEDTVTFFLITDNGKLKDTVTLEQMKLPEEQRRLFTTSVTPVSYLAGSSGDRDALIELYLLSMRSALVINGKEKDYNGTAGKISFFAKLAWKMGFFPETHVMVCSTDG